MYLVVKCVSRNVYWKFRHCWQNFHINFKPHNILLACLAWSYFAMSIDSAMHVYLNLNVSIPTASTMSCSILHETVISLSNVKFISHMIVLACLGNHGTIVAWKCFCFFMKIGIKFCLTYINDSQIFESEVPTVIFPKSLIPAYLNTTPLPLQEVHVMQLCTFWCCAHH